MAIWDNLNMPEPHKYDQLAGKPVMIHLTVRLLRVILDYDQSLSKEMPRMQRKDVLPKHLLVSVSEQKQLNGLIRGEIQVSLFWWCVITCLRSILSTSTSPIFWAKRKCQLQTLMIMSDYKRPAPRPAPAKIIALPALHANETTHEGTLLVMDEYVS